MQTMHINDVFAKNSKMREKKHIFRNTFFLQIGYTGEIRAVNYQFFVQKSAQYRHKCLRKGLHQTKTCTILKPQTSLKTSHFLLTDAMF